jgi:DNA-binding transcriptional MerR regulator
MKTINDIDYCTRCEASHILDCSIKTIRDLEKRGILLPDLYLHETWRYYDYDKLLVFAAEYVKRARHHADTPVT